MHVLYKPKAWFQVVPGLATAQTPIGSTKFDYAPPPGLTRWANAPQLPVRGRGGKAWAHLELTVAYGEIPHLLF